MTKLVWFRLALLLLLAEPCVLQSGGGAPEDSAGAQKSTYQQQASPTTTTNSLATEPISTVGKILLLMTQNIQSTLTSSLAALNEQQEKQNSQLSSQLEQNISQLSSKLEQRVSELSSRLEEKISAVAAELRDNISDLSSQLDEVSSTVTTRVNSTLSTQLEHSSSTLSVQLEQSTSELSSQLEERVSEISAEVRQSISELSNQQRQAGSELSSQLRSALSTQNVSLTELNNILAKLASGYEELSVKTLTGLPVTTLLRDCSDLAASYPSGVYNISLGLGQSVPAYCDQQTDGGGWTVIQRRADILPREDFYRGWQDYKQGFGRLEGEFWWGLENMTKLTTALDRQYQLRVDLEDFEGEECHALYQTFNIGSEENQYRLTAANYSGNAGDSLLYHSGMGYTTKDRDNDPDPNNCATHWEGAWWYKACHEANLNGLYLSGKETTFSKGINWKSWKGLKYSLKHVEMKIRPHPKP